MEVIKFNLQKKRTFLIVVSLYFGIYLYLGVVPANIDNLLTTLLGTSNFGVSFIITAGLIASTFSMLLFGYFGNDLSRRFGRKNVFLITNLVWIISIGLVCISPNYPFFLLFFIIGAIGNGAFLPIGFSIIGDLFGPEERGTKFGTMYFGLFLGNGLGILFGGLLSWRLGFFIGSIFGCVALFAYFKFGIDPKQGYSDPELKTLDKTMQFNYRITLSDLIQLVKTKTVIGILLSVFCSGIATSTLSNWGIFYLDLQINNKMVTIVLYTVAGLGALGGARIGGMLGDEYFKNGKINGRVKVSIAGIVLGTLLLLGFYHNTFVMLGFFGYFFVFFSAGNQFAIYSDVCIPELRGAANSLNGIMINMGGIVGSLFVSSIIQSDITLISVSIVVVLIIWLIGSVFWLISYFYYSKDFQVQRMRMMSRIQELEIIQSRAKLK